MSAKHAGRGLGGARGTRASDHLDMLRGLAAVVVLASHARSLLMPSATPGLGGFDRLMYFVTGIATPAVMVFFVLSGYLVGGGAIRAIQSGRWSWRDYLLARGVRLYLVVVPALFMTLFWDSLSIHLTGGRAGNPDTAMAVVTTQQIIDRTSVLGFAGNVAFVQTILVETFGSDHVLWSLANEAWYYLIFPCLWLALFGGRSIWWRVAHAGLALLMLSFVGWEIALLFPVWLLGVAVSLLPHWRWLAPRWASVLAAIPLAVVLLLYGAGRIPRDHSAEYAVAFAFAPLLWALLHRDEPGGTGWYARLASVLAGCSFTLYLTHVPVLVFLRACWTFDQPWPRDAAHWAAVGAVCVGCIAYAYLLSRLTEARTDDARRWLAKRVFGVRPTH